MRSQSDWKCRKKKNVTSDDLPFDLDFATWITKDNVYPTTRPGGEAKAQWYTVLVQYATDTGFNLQHHKT